LVYTKFQGTCRLSSVFLFAKNITRFGKDLCFLLSLNDCRTISDENQKRGKTQWWCYHEMKHNQKIRVVEFIRKYTVRQSTEYKNADTQFHMYSFRSRRVILRKSWLFNKLKWKKWNCFRNFFYIFKYYYRVLKRSVIMFAAVQIHFSELDGK